MAFFKTEKKMKNRGEEMEVVEPHAVIPGHMEMSVTERPLGGGSAHQNSALMCPLAYTPQSKLSFCYLGTWKFCTTIVVFASRVKRVVVTCVPH